MKANSRTIRVLGTLLLVLGLLLCGSMAWVIHYLQQSINHANSTRWTGSPEFTRTTFSLLYSILAFGAITIGSGAFQLYTGRRNRVVAVLTIGAMLPLLYFIARLKGH